jgi:hypothetical protein
LARQKGAGNPKNRPKQAAGRHSIGTERESSLHRTLKFRYTGGSGRTEETVAGFVADGINGDGEFIEVQTGSFGPLKKKLREFSALGRVKIIHPIVINKYIEVFDEKGKRLYRRKSPRRGSEWDLFNCLLYAPELITLPGLSIELAVVDVTEKRIRDGRGSWRRRGISIRDREMAAWHGCLNLAGPADYCRFVPFGEKETFTVRDLAEKTGINAGLARKCLYVLAKAGFVTRIGRRGNALVYSKAEPELGYKQHF